MENIRGILDELIKTISTSRFLSSLLVIIVSYSIYRVLRTIIDKGSRSKRLKGKKLMYIRLFGNILKYFFAIVTFLMLLQINGFNVSSLLTGLGVAGIIVGLAVQDLIKDVIGGFNILTDDLFSVGDVIKFNDVEGKVISVGLKNTKIRDIETNNIYIIPNGNIKEVSNVSDWNQLTIPISYKEDYERVEIVFNAIAEELKNYKNVNDCVFLGISSFDEYAISCKIRIFCKPEYKKNVSREARKLIKMTLDQEGIEIPYPQIDVHNK